MQAISLEEAWILLESLNDVANQKTQHIWNSIDLKKAIRQQSDCFKDIFLNLDKDQQQAIYYWIEHDDEFRDYFKCLSGNDFITSL